MKFKLRLIDGEYFGVLNGHPMVSELSAEVAAHLMTFGTDVTEEQAVIINEAFNPKLEEIRAKNAEVKELVDVLLESGLFEENNGSYYRVGNPISVPKMLLEKYKDSLDESIHPDDSYFTSLDNFWLKCSLNPNVYARENLFEFLTRWEFVITSKGYVVTYRNANLKQKGNKELHDFIATNYTKIKAQKKAPRNYTVATSDNGYVLHRIDGIFSSPESIGNLQELYNNLSNLSETVYTDAHSGTTQIRIGEVVFIGMDKCNQSQEECEAGLHTASSQWLKKNYYGSQGLICLVNPMEIASVPKGDYGKMRSASYLPIGLAEYDEEGKIIPVSTDVFEDDYDTYTIEELNKLLQEINPANQVIHQLTFSEVPNQVYSTIDEYRVILESKNQSIYPTGCADYDSDGDYEEDDYDYEDDNDYYDDEDSEYEDNW
jgi:hypothetical protein